MDAEWLDCATLPCQFFRHALCLPPQMSYNDKETKWAREFDINKQEDDNLIISHAKPTEAIQQQGTMQQERNKIHSWNWHLVILILDASDCRKTEKSTNALSRRMHQTVTKSGGMVRPITFAYCIISWTQINKKDMARVSQFDKCLPASPV